MKSNKINFFLSLAVTLIFANVAKAQLNVDASNNVGVGNSTPGAKLDVVSTASWPTPAMKVSGSGSDPFLSLVNTSAGGRDYRILSSGTGSSNAGFLRIFDGTAGADRLIINSSGDVGIGSSSITFQTRLDALTTGSTILSGSTSYCSRFVNSNIGSGGVNGLYAYVYGAYGESSGAGNSWTYNYGGYFKAMNSYKNVGCAGVSVTPAAGSLSYGGYFNSSFSGASSGGSYGVVSFAGSNGATNIAIYGSAPSSSNNTLANWAGYFTSDVYVSGKGWISAAWNIISDRQFKTNLNSINNPLEIINKLKPQSYFFDTLNAIGMNFPSEKQYGFVAQDVQKVLPELVRGVKKPAEIDQDGKVIHEAVEHLGVNYNAFIALLTAAMQAQQTKVDSLTTITHKQDSINNSLQNQIDHIVNTCCAAGNRTQNNGNAGTSSVNVELSNADVVILNQNIPNPFAEQTIITYNIPANASGAQILFYDINGRQIKSVDIVKKGPGQLNVYANDLTSGIYSYTLIVDGQIIDTKKMAKQ